MTMRDCEKYMGMFSEALDGALTGEGSSELKTHLKACPACAKEFTDLKHAMAALGNVPPVNASPGFTSKVMEDVRRQAGSAGHGTAASSLLSMKVPFWAAAVASLLIAIILFAVIGGPEKPASPERTISPAMTEPRPIAATAEPLPAAPAGDSRESVLAGEGLVRHNDSWMTLKEKELTDAMDKGLSYYKGKWYTPGDIEKLVLEKSGIVRDGESYIAVSDKDKLDKGLIRVGGRWLTGEQLAEELKTSTLASENLVLHNGNWVTKEEKEMLDKGMIRYQGDWLSKDSLAKRIFEENGLVYVDDRPVTPEIKTHIDTANIVTVPPGVPVRNSVTAFIEELGISDPITVDNVSVYLITLPSSKKNVTPQATLAYVNEAAKTGKLTVAENLSPSVSEITVKNATKTAVFIPAGTMLSGGKQDRIVSDDSVLSANGDASSKLKVYCSEAGRWQGSGTLTISDEIAPTSLKKSIYQNSGQWQLWSLIDLQDSSTLTGSKTSALKDSYSAPDVKAASEKLAPALLKKLPANAVGYAVAVNGRLEMVEVFNNPELLAKAYPAFVRSLAVESASAKKTASIPSNSLVPDAKSGVKKTLETLFFVMPDEKGGEFVFEGPNNLHASAMTHNEAMVHLAITPERSSVDMSMQAQVNLEQRPFYSNPNTNLVFKQMLKEFQEKMKDLPDADGRRKAIEEFAKIDHPYITTILVPYLEDPSAETRKQIAEALALHGTSQATPDLVKALHASRKFPAVADAVSTALARIGDERAVEPLIKTAIGIPSVEQAKCALSALPFVIVRSRNAKLAEMAMSKLVIFAEETEKSVDNYKSKPKPKPWEAGIDDPKMAADQPENYEDLTEDRKNQILGQLYQPVLRTIATLAGRKFNTALDARLWWNLEKEAFLESIER